MAMSKIPGGEKEQINSELEDILTCPICLDILKSPTTLGCFHNYCGPCVDGYSRTKSPDGNSLHCATCHHVTKRGEEPKNLLVNEILQWHKSHKDKNRNCEQCTENNATFVCMDCKIDLCGNCQMNHLRIPLLKGHRIIPIDKDTSLLIDRLIFCDVHESEVIKFNCKPCKKALCIECKVLGHEGHETENISMALERLQPMLRASISNLERVIDHKKEAVSLIKEEKKQVGKKFGNTKATLADRKKELHELIDSFYDEFYLEVDQSEKHEIGELDRMQKAEENSVKEIEGVVQWGKTTLDTAKNATLLTECQGGLRGKLSGLENEVKVAPPLELRTKVKAFQCCDETPGSEELFGKLRKIPMLSHSFNTHTGLVTYPRVPNNVKIAPLCVKKWEVSSRSKEITNDKGWHRIGVVAGNWWLPCPGDDTVSVFTQAGEKVREIKHDTMRCPRAVVQAGGDSVIVACDSGLFCLDVRAGEVLYQVAEGEFSDVCVWGEVVYQVAEGGFSDVCVRGEVVYALDVRTGEVLYQVAEGKFSDVCVWGEVVYALEWGQGQVWKVRRDGIKWVAENPCIRVEYKKNAIYDHHNTLLVDDNYMYVASYYNDVVYKFSHEGKLLSQHGEQSKQGTKPGQLYGPYLCVCDSEGAVLVADRDHHRLQTLGRDGAWRVAELVGVERPIDVIVVDEETLWCLCDYGRRLVKLEPAK